MHLLVTALAIGVTFVIGVVGHELAHAFTARVMRIPVKAVRIGQGRRLLAWRWRGVEWSLGRELFAGEVEVELPRGAHSRWRYLAVVAAGPAFDLVAALAGAGLVLTWIERSGWVEVFLERRLESSLLVGWTVGNVIAFWHVFRREDEAIPGVGAESDGAKLRKLLGSPAELYAYWRESAAAYGAWAERATAEERPPARAHEEGLVVQPEFPALEAAQLALIRAYPEGGPARRQLIDVMGTTALMSGNRAFVRRCLPWSEELVRRGPREWTYLGTHGSLLVVAERWDEGVALLEEMMAGTVARSDRAIGACCLAWAEHRRGRRAERDEWWRIALHQNHGTAAVPWMGRELNAAAPGG